MGTGKTLAQVIILKELIKRGEKCWFTSFNAAVEAYKDPEEKKRLFYELQSSACLAVDEIPNPVSEKQREFFEEVLEWLVRYRVENSMPILMGTNIVISNKYPRVGSLVAMTYLQYEAEGEDARRTSSKEEIEELIKTNETRPVK
jgi:hypothetical protein